MPAARRAENLKRPVSQRGDEAIRADCSNLTQKRVLVVSDGNVLVLGGVGDDFNQAADLGLGIQGHAEQL